MLIKNSFQRGDTLIEVLFAVSVFSLIVVGALAIMNQGTSASQRALETTTTRQAIDGQAETLRFLHESYVSEYQSGTTYNLDDGVTSPAEEYYRIIRLAIDRNAGLGAGEQPTASSFENLTACPATPADSFIIDPRTARVSTDITQLQRAQVAPELTYNSSGVFTASRGLWIEPVRAVNTSGGAATNNAGYIDFHIRGCWDALGADVPVTIGTIVRLYEPRG